MKKTKLAEAAKDLKLDNQELIDLLEKQDGVKRKNTTSLTEDEMNYILEYYSQNNQVESFDAYFESKDAAPEEIQPEPPKEKKKTVKKTASKNWKQINHY
jgi:translation initiation factor IF-2